MGEFLTLVGLAALVIAGIGIGGGVASYLDARRGSIATLKVLGATSGDIARIYRAPDRGRRRGRDRRRADRRRRRRCRLVAALGALLPVAPGFVIEPWPLALRRGVSAC